MLYISIKNLISTITGLKNQLLVKRGWQFTHLSKLVTLSRTFIRKSLVNDQIATAQFRLRGNDAIKLLLVDTLIIRLLTLAQFADDSGSTDTPNFPSMLAEHAISQQVTCRLPLCTNFKALICSKNVCPPLLCFRC